VSVEIDWGWNWKPVIIEDLHVAEFFEGSETREVKPTSAFSVLEIVSIEFNSPKRSSSESGEFASILDCFIIRN
jgi:hypothetical protein